MAFKGRSAKKGTSEIPTLPAPILDENSGIRSPSESSVTGFTELLFSRTLYKSSAFRLGLAISALFLICFSIAWFFSYRLLEEGLLERVDSSLQRRYERIMTTYYESGFEGALQAVENNDGALMTDARGFEIKDSSGDSVVGNVDTDVMEYGWGTLKDGEIGLNDAGSVRYISAPMGGYTVTLAQSLDLLDALQQEGRLRFIKAFLLSTVLALLGSAYAAWRTHTRIDRITSALRSVAAGQLEKRLPFSKNGDDIDEFSERINHALDRLQQNVDGLRQMSSDMAHELKTPLNRLHIQLEGAIEKLHRQDIEVDELGKAMDEAETINATFQAILRIAQIEAGARKAGFEPTNLMEVLDTVCEVYEPVVEEAGNTLETLFDVTDVQYVLGDRELLMQVVVNLIENAIRHCPEGTHITVNGGEYHGEPWFTVADNGPGVPEALREKLFQRLFRLQASRTTPGTGLGMTLVKAVADLHGAKVTLSDNNPGLVITVKFVEQTGH